MHLAYCDESQDRTRTVASAVIVPQESWRDAFDVVRDLRKSLSRRHDIPVQYELHAYDLVGGRGMPGKRKRPLGRDLGCAIFLEALSTVDLLSSLGVYTINVSLPNKDYRHPLRAAVTRLLQRFENNLNKVSPSEYGLVIYDGQEAQHRSMAQRLLRRLQVFNPVPSMIYKGTYRDMPIKRILGDPMIRDSADDIFIQLADLVAYALLRQDNPIVHPISVKHGIPRSFSHVSNTWLTVAARGDPQGVVRN